MDECGLEETIQRDYARGRRGQRCYGEKTGNRPSRTSIIAGLNQETILAPWHFSGHCNTEVILTWIKNELLSSLRVGLTVVWDNATFHKSAQIKALIESVGCKLIFLPPYSPDLNPIEHYWAKLKAHIRRIKQGQMTIPETLALIFQKAH